MPIESSEQISKHILSSHTLTCQKIVLNLLVENKKTSHVAHRLAEGFYQHLFTRCPDH